MLGNFKKWNKKVTIILIMIGAFAKGLLKEQGGLESKRTSGDHPNYSIVENGQNTENSLGDLKRLALTQTQVKDHQLTLM